MTSPSPQLATTSLFTPVSWSCSGPIPPTSLPLKVENWGNHSDPPMPGLCLTYRRVSWNRDETKPPQTGCFLVAADCKTNGPSVITTLTFIAFIISLNRQKKIPRAASAGAEQTRRCVRGHWEKSCLTSERVPSPSAAMF